MYQLMSPIFGQIKIITVLKTDNHLCITFDPANTDYQQFKIDMSNGIELYDADNNLMTSEQITEFLNTLP